jgi:hypothetical protein
MPRPLRRAAARAASLRLVLAVLLVGLFATATASAGDAAVPQLRVEPVAAQGTSATSEPTPSGSPPQEESTPPASEPGASSQGQPANPRLRGRAGRCQVILQAAAPIVTSGEQTTLAGQLACPGGTSPAGQTVAILERALGVRSSFSEVGTANSDAEGYFSFTSAPLEASSVFSVRLAGARSAPARIHVAPRVSISGPPSGAQLATHSRSERSGMVFSGSVTPAVPGERIALQREYLATGEQWHTVALGQVGTDGTYSIAHRFRTPGNVSLRVIVHPGHSNVAAASEVLSYIVAQAQNPKLTIQTSADPVISGQPVTISGLAAGAPGQVVTLLARTAGQAFGAVDKATTDSTGAYTFTASPTRNTYYRVSSASTVSAALFEGYRYLLETSVPPQAAQANQALSFSGTVGGAHGGQPVYLEQKYPFGLGFHVVAEAQIDAADAYALTYAPHAHTALVLRVRVPADADSVGVTGPEFTVGIAPS